MTGCIFCNWDLIKDDVLWENENFLVKVGLGITSPGHVMVVSKKHYTCYAELPEELWEEYRKLLAKVKEFVTKKFSEPISAEYTKWEQSVFHAHTHLIPHKSSEFEIKGMVQELSERGEASIEDFSREKMKQFFEEDGGYVYYMEDGKEYLFRQNCKPDYEKKLCYRPFFTRKGVKGVYGWPLKEEDKKRDEWKRNKTKEVFREFVY